MINNNNKISSQDLIKLYNSIQDNTIKGFPYNTWKSENIKSASTEFMKYLFEEVFKFKVEDLRTVLTFNWFKINKLDNLLNKVFDKSIYKLVNSMYPDYYQEWDLKTRHRYWSKEKAEEAVKWLLEDKLNLDEEEIKLMYSSSLLWEHNLDGALCIYERSSFKLINAAYPNRFKPWELRSTPMNYWNKETAREAVKWLIEDKMKIEPSEAMQLVKRDDFVEYRLQGMLYIMFNNSRQLAITNAYPEIFKQKDFK